MSVSLVEAFAGLLLVFVLPGFSVSRALFPEWRFRGEEGLTRIVETATLSLVLSVALTILLGFGLLNSPVGFSAAWGDPTLEVGLAAITAIALVAAGARGAFSSTPPTAPPLEPLSGEDGGAEALGRAEDLSREERRLRHALRVAPDDVTAARLRTDLGRVRDEARRLGAAREEEYAQ
ncbi:MAG: DUF1616 domain-containing protein [Thermoplasmata archaeon]|nr:DUF1616 domain-containing protein [Thermoplasmata archaeon]